MFVQDLLEPLDLRDSREIPAVRDSLELKETPVIRDSLDNRVCKAIGDLLVYQVREIVLLICLFAYNVHIKPKMYPASDATVD